MLARLEAPWAVCTWRPRPPALPLGVAVRVAWCPVVFQQGGKGRQGSHLCHWHTAVHWWTSAAPSEKAPASLPCRHPQQWALATVGSPF